MQLFKTLTTETSILTPNRRLSAMLLKKHQHFAKKLGKDSWLSPDILPYTSWIQRLWDDYHLHHMDNTPLVLSPQQEIALWESVIQSVDDSSLLHLSATADLVKAAWSILQQWEVSLSAPGMSATEDGEMFVIWANTFIALCAEKNFIDSSSVAQKVIGYITAKKIILPKKLVMAGFTEFTPQQKTLLNLCESLGTEILYLETLSEKKSLTASRLSLADEETEIATMAKWALKIKKDNPDALIGCIIPSLENIRDRVQQIFSDTFAEGRIVTQDADDPFNISAGKTLSSYPVIHAALRMLNLTEQPFSLEDLGFILHSPFMGEAEKERLARAQYDYRLRKMHLPANLLRKMTDPLDKVFLKNFCRHLYLRIQSFFQKKSTLTGEYFLHEWAQYFLELLTLIGWPGERSLNSHEYQVVQRWLTVLFDFRSFSQVLGKQNFTDALHTLTLLTQKTVFQPETSEASVQVLGLLEASGLPFDYTWVMGFDDLTWPPAAKPNPFLPRLLQKNLKMPHANAERELQYSKRLTSQLIQSTCHIVFSHAAMRNDCELRPSSIITHLPMITLQDLKLPPSLNLTEIIFQSRIQESYRDDQAPALASTFASGGSFILKYQAACPFKAFAEIRLGAKPLERPQLGLRAADRGTILHTALEILWKDLKTSDVLQNIAETALSTLVKTAVHQGLKKIVGEEVETVRLYALESQRMQHLIRQWLESEKQRPPFKVIAQEKEFEIKLKDLTFKARIDRIDELSDGSYFIIDYKTGKNNSLNTWFGERPDEPQLPLYFIAHQTVTSAIGLAEIHAENIALKGLSKNDAGIPFLKLLSDLPFADEKDWPNQVAFWQKNFEKLAAEFVAGQATVSPKHPETCQHCHLQTLCRIHERA